MKRFRADFRSEEDFEANWAKLMLIMICHEINLCLLISLE